MNNNNNNNNNSNNNNNNNNNDNNNKIETIVDPIQARSRFPQDRCVTGIN